MLLLNLQLGPHIVQVINLKSVIMKMKLLSYQSIQIPQHWYCMIFRIMDYPALPSMNIH